MKAGICREVTDGSWDIFNYIKIVHIFMVLDKG